MKEFLKNIKKVFESNNYSDLSNSVEEKQFLFLYALYHYYYGDEDCCGDVIDHCKYTREFENFAQGFFEEDTYEDKVIDVLIPYYVEKDFDMLQVNYRISQTQAMIMQIKNNSYSFLGNETLLTDYWNPSSEEKLVLRIITNYQPDFEEKNRITNLINKLVPLMETIKFDIVFGDDIIDEISQLTSDKKSVDYGELLLEKENNYLTYGEEESIITNITAFSLKDNFVKFGKAGLFAMNLRFYIANKKVDEGLAESISEKGDRFWYYNNGIIIVCDDFKIEGKKLKLSNYSIVNGGQTTRMIGVIPFEKDFAISCKVIRNKYEDDPVENTKFVAEIAEASNTQKPINATDIIANRFEQRLLKDKLSKAGVFMQIKRGDAASANLSENYPEPWQKTKNSELGQLLYATIAQKPGTARNSKNKIFSDKSKYQIVFGNVSSYDIDMIKDLLYLKTHYKKWASLVSKDVNSDEVKKGLVKNGYYYFASTIMLMAKFAFAKDLTDALKTYGINSDRGNFIISQIIFNHRIFNDDYAALQNKMYALFEMVYDKYILRGYKILKDRKADLVYSNFTKTDKNYITTIACDVFDDFAYEMNGRVAGVIVPLFYNPSSDDLLNNKEYVEKAIENFDKKSNELEEEETDILSEELKERLTEFRTREYKARNINAYNVFTNKELDRLVSLKPRTTMELLEFGCFKYKPRTKVRNFGKQIIDIIIDVCGERVK